MLETVARKQADLIVNWMRVGFVHGVMNTDNMTLAAETIDYGPCAFMDAYDPDTVFSSIDQMGRYAYGNQPKIAQWNLSRLAEALLPLIDVDMHEAVDKATEVLQNFQKNYEAKWLCMMRAKLGLKKELGEDVRLISKLLKWMQTNHADFTNTFFALSQEEKPSGDLYQDHTFDVWYEQWVARKELEEVSADDVIKIMRQNNPVIIPRNHNVEHALMEATKGNMKPFNLLLNVIQKPYDYEKAESVKAYQAPPKPNERVYQTFCGT